MKELFQVIESVLSKVSLANLQGHYPLSEECDPKLRLHLNQFIENKFTREALSKLDGSISPSVGNFLNLTETVFSLRFDLNNFYIRSNVDYQAGHPGPQFWSTSVNALSTKKYLLDSYSWSNLLSVKQYWEYLKSHDGDWFFQRIDSKKVYQIHLFSLKESNQRSWKYFLDGKKLLKLFTNNRAFFEFCHFEHFDWLAFKEHRVKSIPKASKISSSKTVVTIFADSLDRRIFDIDYMKYFLPNLFRLRNKSVLFRGFTSSASWTYPVLSSIYSGINSAMICACGETPGYSIYLMKSLSNTLSLKKCSAVIA